MSCMPADLSSIGCGTENETSCEPTGTFLISDTFVLASGYATTLMADPSAWVLVDSPELRPEIRPETGRRAIRGHADLATGLVAPAFGPDLS